MLSLTALTMVSLFQTLFRTHRVIFRDKELFHPTSLNNFPPIFYMNFVILLYYNTFNYNNIIKK